MTPRALAGSALVVSLVVLTGLWALTRTTWVPERLLTALVYVVVVTMALGLTFVAGYAP